MNTTYTIADDITTENQATGDVDEVIEALRDWHGDNLYELLSEYYTVDEVIDQLRQALNRREPTDGLEDALAITVR